MSCFKKIAAAVVAAAASVMLLCSFSGVRYYGQIQSYGSEPHTAIGFVCEDGHVYDIAVDEKCNYTLEEVQRMSGYRLSVSGYVDKTKVKGIYGFEGVLHITSVEIIEP